MSLSYTIFIIPWPLKLFAYYYPYLVTSDLIGWKFNLTYSIDPTNY